MYIELTLTAYTSPFRCVNLATPESPSKHITRSFNQSIKGPHKATHGRRRSHIPAAPQGANPASRSDTGLGGYERVATALVCETRSFSTPFIFQWRA